MPLGLFSSRKHLDSLQSQTPAPKQNRVVANGGTLPLPLGYNIVHPATDTMNAGARRWSGSTAMSNDGEDNGPHLPHSICELPNQIR